MKDNSISELLKLLSYDQQIEISENEFRKPWTESEKAEIQKILRTQLEKQKTPGKRTDLEQKNSTSDTRMAEVSSKRINHEIGKIFRESHDKVRKRDKIFEHNDPEIIKKIEQGKLTINKAEKIIKKKEKFQEKQELLKKVRTNLPDFVTLHNKPFQKCKLIKKARMVFTDTPYLKTDLPLIDELAKHVMCELEDGGIFLCYMGHHILDQAMEIFKKRGLTYQWIFSVKHKGPSTMMWKNRIMVCYKPILFFSKGKYQYNEPIRDLIESESQGKELHEWAQSTVESDYYIDHMT